MRPVAVVIRLIVPPLILVVGLWAGWGLFSNREVPELTSIAEVAAPVRVIETPAIDTTIDVTAWGTVTAARTLELRSAVSGRLVQLDTNFVPGGLFQTGQVLAQIDRRDYEFSLRQAEAGLETAKFNLEVEQGRGRVAERDWALLGDEIGGERRISLRSRQHSTRREAEWIRPSLHLSERRLLHHSMRWLCLSQLKLDRLRHQARRLEYWLVLTSIG
jgi:multidrug resistance efflux pump